MVDITRRSRWRPHPIAERGSTFASFAPLLRRTLQSVILPSKRPDTLAGLSSAVLQETLLPPGPTQRGGFTLTMSPCACVEPPDRQGRRSSAAILQRQRGRAAKVLLTG